MTALIRDLGNGTVLGDATRFPLALDWHTLDMLDSATGM